jgi:hypothetical protein
MPSYKFKPHINNEKLFKKLHIEEGTEVFNSANKIIDEVNEFISKNMCISAWFVESNINLIGLNEETDKTCIICLVSSRDEIGDFSREMMDGGSYLKGYLLYEAANYALFEASEAFSQFVRQEELKNGYKLGRRHFAGGRTIDLDIQREILEILKKQEDIDVYINERDVLFPGKSLLYVFAAEEEENGCCIEYDEENECVRCKNNNCQYRDEK